MQSSAANPGQPSSSARDGVGFSVISLYEIGLLIAKRRIEMTTPLKVWRLALIRNGLVEEPVTGAVAVAANDLQGLPNDPGDRLIAATAVTQGATLVTSDEKEFSAGRASSKNCNARK